MTEALRRFKQATLWGDDATGSPESEDGSSRCDGLGGRTKRKSGRDRARASRSAPQASGKVRRTNGTSGPSGSGSFESDALSACLASRLHQRLGTVGSMEYSQTWREKATPAGRSYWEHTASGRRTSDSAFSGWPTARAEDAESAGTRHSRGVADTLTAVARLAGWPSPNANERGPEKRESKDARGSGGIDLQSTAKLAGWSTPSAMGGGLTSRSGSRKGELLLGGQARGATSTSYTAPTGKPGALNPELSRWLMGFPAGWGSSADTETRSSRRSRRSS